MSRARWAERSSSRGSMCLAATAITATTRTLKAIRTPNPTARYSHTPPKMTRPADDAAQASSQAPDQQQDAREQDHDHKPTRTRQTAPEKRFVPIIISVFGRDRGGISLLPTPLFSRDQGEGPQLAFWPVTAAHSHPFVGAVRVPSGAGPLGEGRGCRGRLGSHGGHFSRRQLRPAAVTNESCFR
jgi:hypothetical protein